MIGYVNAPTVLAGSLLLAGLTWGDALAGNATEGDMTGMVRQHYLFSAGAEPKCRLVLPSNPEHDELAAAELIAEILAEMGGGKAELVREPLSSLPPFDGVDIHVGNTEFARGLSLLPTGMDHDGFLIHPADPGRLMLLGRSPVGTFYAATEFLERYAGVLWVWPGENGTVIPTASRFAATVHDQRSEPAFLSRAYFGMDGNMAYYRIHRGSQHGPPGDIRIKYHHNIRQVMPAGHYATRPKWFNFSRKQGKRLDPGSSVIHWQACTSNPEVIGLFAQAAKQQFVREPRVLSFSVSQNDGGGFCECDTCLALDVPGVSGASDRYFAFANAVADGIREAYPERFIACLAYSGTVNPPVRVELRPNVLPVLVVPALRDKHESVIEWSKASSRLGAYFWLHGKAVPKYYPHRWAEYLRFLRRHGCIHVNAEVYQRNPQKWASWELDGPRIWITSKLLWDPDADIDELMRRFCGGFYGPAAEPMLAYYGRCEAAWERRKDPFDFGRNHTSQDFEIYSAADMDFMEECVRQAIAMAAADEVVTARLTALDTRLSPVAGYVRQLDLVKILDAYAPDSLADAEAIVARVYDVERAERRLTDKGLSLFGTLLHETEMSIDKCFCRITERLGDEAAAFWNRVMETSPELGRFVALQVLDMRGAVAEGARMPMAFEGASTGGADWLPLPGDRHAAGDVYPGWSHWIGQDGGRVGIATKVGHAAPPSLVIAGARNACGIYTFAVKHGDRYRVSVWAKTSVQAGADRSPVGGAFTLRYQGPYGWAWDTEVRTGLPAGASEWRRLTSIVTVPRDMPRLSVMLSGENQQAGEQTWFDDLLIERIAEK